MEIRKGVSMASHSPTPWSVAKDIYNNPVHLQDSNGEDILQIDLAWEGPDTPEVRPADARRIVACVNALAGVPTEALENLESGPGRVLYYELHEPLPPLD
jgi:hypothetical protein